MEVKKELFGELGGHPIYAYELKNDRSISVTVLEYGCIINKIMVPDRIGKAENIVLGFDSLDGYVKDAPYFGAIIGRVAGRIAGSSFELDGKTYKLANNENRNHLHGGLKGFNAVIWNSTPIEEDGAVGVEFTYTSPDGEEGYPGKLDVTVMYLLTNEQELKLSYRAVTDKKTILNMTNHAYFNLSGDLKRDVRGHELSMPSDYVLELDQETLPTGKKLDVTGTAFDFRNGRKIEGGTVSNHPQNVLVGNGFDHPFLLSNHKKPIVLKDDESGRVLKVETDQPCVVVYTCNTMGNDEYEIRGRKPCDYLGICLEAQGVPDAVHHPEFPSIVLKPGEEYRANTKLIFS
ncbi:aldose 1-epimerase [Weizmannia acidilactici]|uniref:Aldose 1-epimerase n=1 Tax=Weizmannia acidilactici TaxID=2607726 RepID=A0A5J4J1E5_9BACI|nr:aldose epimerase family protein [Weizmannia acidilactici]GER67453.1 aldose 1-epimerase [Weizmannia acidilactici]GER68746.1 aldose 1-epimerase [Weizmannia acidilactici]GER72968.1 aldose 1-epimerase [Weizmannia acidilactici]